MSRLSQTNFEVSELLEIGYVLCFALVAFTILFTGLRQFIARGQGSLSSVYQGSIRFNTYIGIPLVIAFYGSETIALGAVFIGLMVPFINVVCVWVLAKYGGGGASTLVAVKELSLIHISEPTRPY